MGDYVQRRIFLLRHLEAPGSGEAGNGIKDRPESDFVPAPGKLYFRNIRSSFSFQGYTSGTAWEDPASCLCPQCSFMGERIKAVFAMVAAHTAHAHAAKAHLGSGKMDDGIVDAAAA